MASEFGRHQWFYKAKVSEQLLFYLILIVDILFLLEQKLVKEPDSNSCAYHQDEQNVGNNQESPGLISHNFYFSSFIFVESEINAALLVVDYWKDIASLSF